MDTSQPTSWYLDDLFNVDSNYTEVQLNKANPSDTEVPFFNDTVFFLR